MIIMAESEGYRRIASIYDLIVSPVFKKMRKVVLEVSKAKEGDRLLEVACGTGEQALIFAHNGVNVTGVDVSEQMIKRAKKKTSRAGKDINYLLQDASKLPFKNKEFDITTVSLGIHEIPPETRDKIIKEMIRVTKDKGCIVIADYEHPDKKGFLQKMAKMEIITAERIAGKNHYNNYKTYMENGALHSLAKKFNLKIEEEQRYYGGNVAVLRLRKNNS